MEEEANHENLKKEKKKRYCCNFYLSVIPVTHEEGHKQNDIMLTKNDIIFITLSVKMWTYQWIDKSKMSFLLKKKNT